MDELELGKVVKRRHPEYSSTLPHWNFLEQCYEGGRDWFGENIFRYIKEGDTEYSERVKRSYRFNHTKEVVDLVGKYIFKSKIYRNKEEAPEPIRKFWQASSKNGKAPIQKLIRNFEKKSSIYGRVWIVVDNNRSVEAPADGREYAYYIKPQDLLDVSYDESGNINWVLVKETYRDDEDPFTSSGNVGTRYRLWTRTHWYEIKVINENARNEDLKAEITDSLEHGLGVVPVFPLDHSDSEEFYTSPALISDIAYLDRACANYLSNLDAIIQDQAFSQLAMPAQGLMPGEDAYNKMLEAGTKRIFLYDGENGGQPFYLSPDPRQAELIVTVISKIVNEIYHTVGMAGERTKQDNSVGIDNSSGVAKAYDFERVNALLATKAASLRHAEIKMAHLVMLWNGDSSITEEEISELITYPETFDVRGIADEFSIASNLSLIEAPSEMRKEQLRVLVDKLFPRIKTSLKEKMLSEINNMSQEDFTLMLGGSSLNNEPNTGMKNNRQGENNKDESNQ